jgi:hypothetical protein
MSKITNDEQNRIMNDIVDLDPDEQTLIVIKLDQIKNDITVGLIGLSLTKEEVVEVMESVKEALIDLTDSMNKDDKKIMN